LPSDKRCYIIIIKFLGRRAMSGEDNPGKLPGGTDAPSNSVTDPAEKVEKSKGPETPEKPEKPEGSGAGHPNIK
jgi:hypothetical protein